MFGIAPSELFLLAIVALVVVGPKDLPRVMRTVGTLIGRARGVAGQFRSSFDEIIREAELVEAEKRWKIENERIIREHQNGLSLGPSKGLVGAEESRTSQEA